MDLKQIKKMAEA